MESGLLTAFMCTGYSKRARFIVSSCRLKVDDSSCFSALISVSFSAEIAAKRDADQSEIT